MNNNYHKVTLSVTPFNEEKLCNSALESFLWSKANIQFMVEELFFIEWRFLFERMQIINGGTLLSDSQNVTENLMMSLTYFLCHLSPLAIKSMLSTIFFYKVSYSALLNFVFDTRLDFRCFLLEIILQHGLDLQVSLTCLHMLIHQHYSD